MTVAALSAAAIVAAGCLFFGRKSHRNYLALPEVVRTEAPTPAVAVIIPARNEEANIERCVRSFPGLRVIVVDDASTDRTAELARAAGAEVVSAPALLKGAKGKPNACWAGSQHAETEWLLFVDADTWYEPAFVSSLAAYAEREKLDAATVFPKQELCTWSERMLLPYAFALYFTGVSAEGVNNPATDESLANGQCLLYRTGPYRFTGGHRAVIGSVIEDVELARIVKRHRLKLRVLRSESLAHVRMYDSLQAIWRGFEKNSFRFLLINPKTGAQVVMASILMTSWLPVLVVLLAAGLPLAAAAFALLPAAVFAPWYGGFLRALLAAPAIYLFQLIALNGMISTTFGRKAIWKGRPV